MGIKFEVPIGEIVDELENHIFDVLNTLTAMTYNNIVALSPVDTGRYRNAHHFSHGSPSHAMSGATGIRIPVGDYRPIYIQNNLPYALRIENGWSGQAPSGVYGNAVNSALASL
ncbi:hypothetical protein [Moraxella bovoculi]|uniref:hypothetical protein n=1 Tax=Moraxella bovoculi TaxID=386891 RepID=UPI000624A86A|nr:hypothetical protein [Moraxella bovoculi]AKG14165.1 hypothetical protein AAX11_09220 [Moraxella bovoculi]